MRLILVCIILLFPVSHAFAQNTFTLYTNVTPNFNFTTAASLESNYTVSNAYTLAVKPKSSAISMYVKLYSFSAPTGYTTGAELQLDYSTVNSTTGVTNLITTAFDVTMSDTKLFNLARNTTTTYNFKYHAICTAPGYTTTVGHYNFTLQFTMTSP